MNNTIAINHGKTRMIAHRGVSGLERENTCSAFVAACNRSYYGIETDVHRTLDGEFVCIHDSETGRVGVDQLTVEKTTFDTLRSLVLTDMDGKRGRTDLRIPTMVEYVRLCKRYGKTGILELKGSYTVQDLAEMVSLIRREEYLDGITFIAFDLSNLLNLRSLLPKQPCQFLTTGFSDETLKILTEYRLDLDAEYRAVTRECIDKCHENGIQVNAWTVDSVPAADRLVSWNVDYITSNILE
ncbi:MAG: hypothetical protein IJJ23_11655 [Clostridia bacterium]|nr:hypothetical protein [Clostridia bacterium]